MYLDMIYVGLKVLCVCVLWGSSLKYLMYWYLEPLGKPSSAHLQFSFELRLLTSSKVTLLFPELGRVWGLCFKNVGSIGLRGELGPIIFKISPYEGLEPWAVPVRCAHQP